jgi:hypothetical protein
MTETPEQSAQRHTLWHEWERVSYDVAQFKYLVQNDAVVFPLMSGFLDLWVNQVNQSIDEMEKLRDKTLEYVNQFVKE